jgi:hypothetical protein
VYGHAAQRRESAPSYVGHSPTERAAQQTADIARRLMRDGELHQEAGAS